MLDRSRRQTQVAIKADFASKTADYYDRNYGSAAPGWSVRQVRRALIEAAAGELLEGGTVLDAGCGPSLLYPRTLERAQRYVAADFVPENLDEISQANPPGHVETLRLDLSDPAQPIPAVDLIVCAGVLEYVPDAPAALHRLLSSAAANCGSFVGSFPNRRSPYRLWHERIARPLGHRLRPGSPGYPRRLFDVDELNRIAGRAGFKESSVLPYGFEVLPTPLENLLPRLRGRIGSSLGSRQSRAIRPYAAELLLICRS